MTAAIETSVVEGVRVLRLARPPVNAIALGVVGELEAALGLFDGVEAPAELDSRAI